MVLVMGASRGLGRSVAEAFAERDGWDTVAVARSEFDIPGVRCLRMDVCDEPGVTELIGSLDRLDVVVNNAAIARVADLLETPTEDLREQFEINVAGPFVVMREACRRMVEAGEGLIINVGSIFSLQGYGRMAPYCATKHALLGLSRSVRNAVRDRGVRVCTYCPGDMNTDILGDLTRDPKRMDTADLAPTFVHIAELPSYVEVGELVVNPLPR